MDKSGRKPTGRLRPAKRVALALAVMLTAGAAAAGTAQAAATFPTMNDDGGIYWRSSPNWNSPIVQPDSGIFPGTYINVECYESGTAVPGSADTMWVQATIASGPGQGSGWVDEHFVNDGAPIDQAAPGIPACGSTMPPTTTPPTSTPPTSTPPGVTCSGNACSGEDPSTTGCSRGAITTASIDLGMGELDLRWSPTCKTNWARLYVFPTRTLGPAEIYAVQPSTGYSTQAGGVDAILSFSPASETDWSPMIYSPTRCVTANFDYAPFYSWNVSSTACR